MQNTANSDVRVYAFSRNIPLWRVAEKMGISNGYLSKLMRSEMDLSTKSKIKSIIDELSN